MRYIVKTLTVIGLIAVCVFGATVIYTNNDLQRFLPQQSQNEDITVTPAQSQTDDDDTDTENDVTFQTPTIYIDGQPVTGQNEAFYVHENNFEVGKTTYVDQTIDPTIKYDERQRVSEYAVRITPDTVLMYASTPDGGNAFVAHELADNTPLVPVTNDAWRNVLHPYLNAIAKYVRDSNNDVVLVIGLTYDKDTDKAPHYIDVKAFSPHDLGKTCNIWVTVYNYDPDQQVDYTTLTYFGQNVEITQPVDPPVDTKDGDSNG